MKKILSILGFVLALGLAQPASATIETYILEKPHTQILFFADHLGFSKSMGKFTDFDGTFEFNISEPEKSKVDATIKTGSLEMNHDKWNAHMKGEDFFNVEVFPTMTFKSTGIEVTGDKTANITGDLTILETTKPVTLAVTHNLSGKHAFSGKYVSGFSAAATIKRSDFGMTYGLPLVGDEVEIRLEVEGIRKEEGGEGLGNK